jgi:hypothetical protein
MAWGGKRRGAGRKRTSTNVPMMLRVPAHVRAGLEAEAKQTGKTLTAVMVGHLSDALRPTPSVDKHTRALCYLIGSIARLATSIPPTRSGPGADAIPTAEFNWRTNQRDFEIFRLLILRLLNQFAPAESQVPHDELLDGVEADIKEEVKALYFVISVLLYAPEEEAYAVAAAHGAETGSPLCAFQQAARDLDLRRRENR